MRIGVDDVYPIKDSRPEVVDADELYCAVKRASTSPVDLKQIAVNSRR